MVVSSNYQKSINSDSDNLQVTRGHVPTVNLGDVELSVRQRLLNGRASVLDFHQVSVVAVLTVKDRGSNHELFTLFRVDRVRVQIDPADIARSLLVGLQ